MLYVFVFLTFLGVVFTAPYELVEVITFNNASQLDFPIEDLRPASINSNDDVNVKLPCLKFYNFGVHYKGERYVGEAHDTRHWPTKQSVQLGFNFICQNSDDIINFVQILAYQDSCEGKAWIVAGGIGQKFISIIMVADDTTMLGFQASIYAIKT